MLDYILIEINFDQYLMKDFQLNNHSKIKIVFKYKEEEKEKENKLHFD